MTHRYPLQHCDLIPNLQSSGLSEPIPSASPNLNLINECCAELPCVLDQTSTAY